MISTLVVKDVIQVSNIFKGGLVGLLLFSFSFAFSIKPYKVINEISWNEPVLDPSLIVPSQNEKYVYLMDRANSQISLYSKSAVYLSFYKFYPKGFIFLTFTVNPISNNIAAITKDIKQNYYFVIFDRANFVKKIVKIPLDKIKNDIEKSTNTTAKYYRLYPRVLKYNPVIKKYILVNLDDSNVILFNKNGTYTGIFNYYYKGYIDFRDVKIDNKGNMYFLSKSQGQVFIFNPKFEFVDSIGTPGGDYCQIALAFSSAVTPDGKYIIFSDFQKSTLIVYSINGTCIGEFGQGGYLPGQFQGPFYIDLDKKYLYVVDKYNRRFQILNYKED